MRWKRAGAARKDVDVVNVPGASNCRWAAKKLAATGKYDALIAIGCVLARNDALRVCLFGDARGLQLAQMDSGLPIMFCVLTCDLWSRPSNRPVSRRNKGFEGGARRHRNGAAVTQASRFSFEPAAAGKPGASNVSLRTKSREFAMQMLFQWDMSQQDFTKLE